jgi:hypothetical protein
MGREQEIEIKRLGVKRKAAASLNFSIACYPYTDKPEAILFDRITG